MKVFFIGMPKSGRTTVAKALCQENKRHYIDTSSWVKCSFRDPNIDEHPQQYHDEYHQWFTNRLKINPYLCIDEVIDSTSAIKDNNKTIIIDNIVGPKDFIHLFDYNNDIVIFMNRTDTDTEYKDYESIGVSVIRDYCYWLSSASLLSKDKWLEFNFKIPGEESDVVKKLGSKNTIMIVKSTNKVIEILNSYFI